MISRSFFAAHMPMPVANPESSAPLFVADGFSPTPLPLRVDFSIYAAASEGHTKPIRDVLSDRSPTGRWQDADPAFINGALQAAAEAGRVYVVDFLLEAADPRALDVEGVLPLMRAAAMGHGDCVARLLPFAQGNASATQTAFRLSVAHERWDCAELLAQNAPAPDLQAALSFSPGRDLPLMRAALERRLLLGVVSDAAGARATTLADGPSQQAEPARRAPRSL